MHVTYEWKIEALDPEDKGPDPDIVEVFHFDGTAAGLAEARAEIALQRRHGMPARLVLVRDVGNEIDGITERDHAYVADSGRLPEWFEDSTVPVPQRFHAMMGVP